MGHVQVILPKLWMRSAWGRSYVLGNKQGVGTASAAVSIHSCSIEEGDADHLSDAHMIGFEFIRETT